MDKRQAHDLLKQHLLEGAEKNITITNEKPDGIYLPSEGDYWYCHIPNQPPAIGATRIVAISKETGKVVFDGYCGE